MVQELDLAGWHWANWPSDLGMDKEGKKTAQLFMAGEANGKTQRKRVASPPPGEEEKLPLLGGDPDPAKAIAQVA